MQGTAEKGSGLHGDLTHAGTALISVVIASYNQAHFLGEAIESVLAQSYRYYEIVVVDDGSRDQAAAVVQRYGSVRYIPQAHRGLGMARNRGIHESQGQFLVILDADDRLLPDHFRDSLQAFAVHPQAAAVCGNYRIIGEGDPVHTHCCDLTPDAFGTLLAVGGFPGPPATAMFRMEVVHRLGGIRCRFEANADYDLFLRVAQRYVLYCHHGTVCEYRRHGGQRTKDAALMLRSVMAVLRSHRQYVRSNPQYAIPYRQAYRRFRETYGDALLWQTVAAVKAGHLYPAARGLMTLLRWYPAGLSSLVAARVRATLKKKLTPPRRHDGPEEPTHPNQHSEPNEWRPAGEARRAHRKGTR